VSQAAPPRRTAKTRPATRPVPRAKAAQGGIRPRPPGPPRSSPTPAPAHPHPGEPSQHGLPDPGDDRADPTQAGTLGAPSNPKQAWPASAEIAAITRSRLPG